MLWALQRMLNIRCIFAFVYAVGHLKDVILLRISLQAGFFCTAASVVPDPMPCLPGRIGIEGMTSPECAGWCFRGNSSTLAKTNDLFANFHCSIARI